MKNKNNTINDCRDTVIEEMIDKELERQKSQIVLIASENFPSKEVIKTMGSVLTNKYAEGYPGDRYYTGCTNVDNVEETAINRANELFNSTFSNVQPHSGVQANTAVFLSILDCGDKILSMNLRDGGHLSHGHVQNITGKYFNVSTYNVDPESEAIDYENVRKIAKIVKPKLIICGASSYPRKINFKKFREIADEVDAYLMADIAHIAGLIAGGQHPTSIGMADFTTATTHKTLRGPRGGMILSDKKYAGIINKSVFPGIQGGPLMHVIAAKAVCFGEALKPDFKVYAKNIIENSSTLCNFMKDEGFRIVSGGTDNHLFLIDLTDKGLTGSKASNALESVGIITNKNVIPFDKLNPNITSGIRIGTPAVTSQGMGKNEMLKIGELISYTLKNIDNDTKLKEVSSRVKELVKDFPVYSEN